MEGGSDQLESKEAPPKTTERNTMPAQPEVTSADEQDLFQSATTKAPQHS